MACCNAVCARRTRKIVILVVLSPLLVIVGVVVCICRLMYTALTCQCMCCRPTMQQEFGERFDTSAPHYDHKRRIFQNHWDSFSPNAWYDSLLMVLWDSPAVSSSTVDPADAECLQFQSIDWAAVHAFHDQNDGHEINHVWFGHSSCLIQVQTAKCKPVYFRF